MVISNYNSFRVLFDKIASVLFYWKIHSYFSIGNGHPREPALCRLYRHTFVPYIRRAKSAIPDCLFIFNIWLIFLEKARLVIFTIFICSSDDYMAEMVFLLKVDWPPRLSEVIPRARRASTDRKAINSDPCRRYVCTDLTSSFIECQVLCNTFTIS